MAIAKVFNVVVKPAGNEQTRTEAYHKALQYVINKCMCEVNKIEGSNICEGLNRRTGRAGIFYTGTEGRMR